MKKRRNYGRYAALLIILFALGGCSGKNPVMVYPDSQKASTTITFFGNKYEPENVTVIEEIISGFMKENPGIRVSYESLKGTEYFDALKKRMATGKGDDVFMVNHDVLLELEAEGKVADLSGLSTIPAFSPQMLSQMNENGKIYWVPTTVSVFGLYCNTDLLKAHKQKIPQNLKEWEAVCSYFVSKGITPVIANNDISLKTLAIGKGFFSTYQENSQKETFNRLNRGEETLSRYLQPGFSLAQNFISKGYINAGEALQTKKTSDDLQEFVKGQAPFMLTGAWAAGRVKAMKPSFAFQVEPLPVLEDGALLVINADTRLSVNADSPHADAAMKFVEYFTKAENIKKFADQQSSFSPLKSGRPSSVKEIQPLISTYQSGRTVIGTDGLLNLPIWDLTKQASQKLLAGQSLNSVMDWLDKEAAKERGSL